MQELEQNKPGRKVRGHRIKKILRLARKISYAFFFIIMELASFMYNK